MARYLDGETRQRFAAADKNLEACERFLTHPAVANLGSDAVKRALSHLDLLYVPNFRDGVYDISQGEHAENGVPYIVTQPGEQVRVRCNPDLIIHPAQTEGVRQQLGDLDHSDITDEVFSQAMGWIREAYVDMRPAGTFTMPAIDDTTWAYVWTPGSGISLTRNPKKKSKTYGVETRPIIIANRDQMDNDEGKRLYHELIHVAQSLEGVVYSLKPKKLEKDRQRAELEAYSAQAIAEEAYFGISIDENPYLWRSMGIEAVRRLVNADSNDPYKISKTLLEITEEIGAKL